MPFLLLCAPRVNLPTAPVGKCSNGQSKRDFLEEADYPSLHSPWILDIRLQKKRSTGGSEEEGRDSGRRVMDHGVWRVREVVVTHDMRPSQWEGGGL